MKKILFLAVALVALILSVGSALAGDAPTITSTAVEDAKVGQQYNYEVKATDPEGSNITYKLITKPTTMTINQTTGKIEWTPTTAGQESVTVEAEDNESLTDTQSFTITVVEDKGVFSIPELTLGSNNQDRGETISKQFTITNTGIKTINNIYYTLNNVPTELNMSITLGKQSLAKDESMTMTIEVYVPLSQDSGEQNIGSIRLQGDNADSITSQINLETESLIDFDITLDGSESGSESLSDGEEVDVEPFESFTLTIEFENIIDEDEDISMDFDIDIDSDDLREIDGERESINNVDGEEVEEIDFDFSLDPDDYDVDDEPFDITITITATDDRGAVHKEVIEVTLELDVENEDLRIRNSRLSTTILYCEDNILRTELTLYNVGSRDVDEGMLNIEVNELDINEWIRDIEIDKDEDEDYSVALQIPRDARPGVYYVDITAYGTDDRDDDTDVEVLEFTINECANGNDDDDDNGNEDSTDNGNNNGETTVITTNQSAVQVSGTPVSSSTGSSFFEGEGYLIALGVIVLLLLVAVVVLLVKVAK